MSSGNSTTTQLPSIPRIRKNKSETEEKGKKKFLIRKRVRLGERGILLVPDKSGPLMPIHEQWS